MSTRFALLSVALSLSPSLVEAQTADVTALLRAGVTERHAGHDDEALARFTEAHARCHCAEARAQMALAAQALGRFTLAEAWLSEALDARGDQWLERNRADLEAARSEVRARVGTLVLLSEAGASLRIDDEPRGELSASGTLTVRLMPGPHRVAVVARDGRRAEESVVSLAGAESVLRVALPPPPTPPPRVIVTEPSRWRRAAPWLAIAGGAGLVGGAVAFAFERRYTAIWESPACVSGNRTREENCGPERVSAERAEAAAIASWAVGGAMIVGAAAMWWLAPRTSQRLSLRCAPTGLDGVACGGAF